MDKQIDQKLESLLKFVPFIDYIVKIDSEKYVKFVDIRKWIIEKKRLPLSDLNKIEQSIITNYKNIILLEDKKIPQEIAQIFYNDIKHQYVDLCSDDEDSGAGATNVERDKPSKSSTNPAVAASGSKQHAKVHSDSEDDIEIVSIFYPQKLNKAKPDPKTTLKTEGSHNKSTGSSPPRSPNDLDDDTAKLLEQIDQITCEDTENKCFKPNNYHIVLSDEDETKEEQLFQRRTRRQDCKSLAESKEEKKPKGRCSNLTSIVATTNTISLDSSDDENTTIQNNCDKTKSTETSGKMVYSNKVEVSSKALNDKTYPCFVKVDNCSTTDEISSSRSSTNCKNSSVDIQTENLTNDEMCRLIENEVKNLNGNELQELMKHIMRKEPLTESRMPSTDKDVSSPDRSSDCKQNEQLGSSSPTPPAPRMEPTISPERLIKALCEILEKAQQTNSTNIVETSENVENYDNRPNMLPITPATPPQYRHHHPPQQQELNVYNNPATQSSIYHQSNAIPQPNYPPTHVFVSANQQARVPINPQAMGSGQVNLKSRDPRARSALYQNTLKRVVEAEVAKRNNIAQPNNGNQSHIHPVLLPNNLSAAGNQPMEMSSPLSLQQQQHQHQHHQQHQHHHHQQQQQQHLQQQQHYILSTGLAQSNMHSSQQLYGMQNNTTNISDQSSAKTTKATLTYGEYKRRKSEEEKRRQEAMLLDIGSIPDGESGYKGAQVENQHKAEKLQTEVQIRKDKREKEVVAKQQVDELKHKDAEELERIEAQKKRLDLHSILYTTLQPYGDKIEKVWNAKKEPVSDKEKIDIKTDSSKKSDKQEGKLTGGEKENDNDVSNGKKRKNDVLSANDKCVQQAKKKPSTEEDNTNSIKNDTNKKSDKSQFDEQKERISNRVNRMYKEMECTFKGFEQLPKTIEGKRRSSLHARMVISEQLKNSQSSEIQENDKSPSSLNEKHLSTTTGIDTQKCNPQFGGYNDCSSAIYIPTPPIRRSSVHARSAIAEQLNSQSSMDSNDNYIPSADNVSPCSSKAHPTDCINRRINVETNSSDSEMNDFERFRATKTQKLTETMFKKQPKVLLRRLTEGEIRKHSKIQNKSNPNIVLNVHLIESGIRPDTTNDIPKAATTASKKSPLKRCNNDCQMTERNTKFCVLCSSKPSDLTNHYKRKHKSESYVSRLTWSELDELCINTPFAKLVPSTNSRIQRYNVVCPFCGEELLVPFMQLYNHYASHTGEYAFQCAACQLDKPFRADIQSHQLHSKNCRNSQIQTMYRYPSNTMSIYLHYCTICNFVQLNEANILKHLREHHDPRKSTAENVAKCILAAISDGPESNNTEAQPTNNMAQSQTVSSDNTEDVEMNEPIPEIETPVVTKSEIDINLDDNIPVFNEACSEERIDLEERLRQMHEGQSCRGSVPKEPMTVIHIGGQSSSVGTTNIGRVLNKPPSRHVPKVVKTEAIDFDENVLLTPPRHSTVSNKSRTKNISSYSIYRTYPPNVNYLGFYKCMAGDCFYSSDGPEEFVKHLEGHQQEILPEIYLNCPYCIIPAASCKSVLQLVEHIQMQHAQLLYQCSMCCYRSCDGSNVLIHQKENHTTHFRDCKIYKCPGAELPIDSNYIKENMSESVGKVQCPYCSISYYNTVLLMQHISADHNTDIQERIKRYSCVYCFFWDKDQSVTRKHVALNHPGEIPFMCDHNSSTVTEDTLHNLETTNLTQPVRVIEVPSTYDTVRKEMPMEDSNVEDIKPSIEELIRCHTETVKIRLRKLTEKTGMAPDCLYRCPQIACGGFFSIYDLWLRHMRLKHNCLECTCPHCPIQTTKPLEDFKMHFEEHRRHTYICFHCPRTSSNSQQAQDHWLRDHNDLGLMHVEQIRFNINYSYNILIQSEKCQNQPELLTSLCDILERRIKDLDINESTKLKHKWLVPTNSTALWLEDYPKRALSPKLVKRCFNGTCNFRTKSDETLFSHVRTNHDISGSIFKCSKCDFRLENSSCWDDALNHIKQHSETSFFVCSACTNFYLCRSKIAEHIRSEHAARDVPIVNLLKTDQSLYAKIAIVFANERLTFSTMHNCFCCEERYMKGNAFMLHLKRYHKFVLNYFCEWCNLPIDSLQSAQQHYQKNHTTNKLKIRCELASTANLTILSVNDFRIQISCNFGDQTDKRQSPIIIKEDPDADDSVIIVEDDDILVENYVKTLKTIEDNAEKPKLKCIAMSNLLDPSATDPNSPQNAGQLRILPRVKIVKKRPSSSDPVLPADKLYRPYLSSTIETGSVISSQLITLAPPSSTPNNQPSSNQNSNTHNNSINKINNMMGTYQYGWSSKRPPINTLAHTPSVQSTNVPTVVSSLGSTVSSPHCYNSNSMTQAVTKYSNSSYRPNEMQNTHAKNMQHGQGVMTTSFLNYHQMPNQTTQGAAITIDQNASYVQNVLQAPNVSTIPTSPYVPTGYTHIQSGLPPSRTAVTTIPTKLTAPQPQLYVNSPQIHTPLYAVTNSVCPSSGHTTHPQYNLPSSASVSFGK